MSALIDVDRVEEWNKANAATPYRVREGAFRVPSDASPEVTRSALRDAMTTFFSSMEKRDLALASKDFQVSGPFEAREINDLVLPGYDEFRIRALFRYTGPAGTDQVIEIPSVLFRHNWGEEPNLDDISVVKELYKALGD